MHMKTKVESRLIHFSYFRLDDLKQELEHDSGVPTSEQILMTSFGDVVRPETLRQVMESKGKVCYL
jgi:hypothetical protein